MKHLTKTLLALVLGALLALSCGLLVACGESDDTGNTGDDEDDQGGTTGGGIAGTYTLVDEENDITYSLEIMENNDFEMQVTKDFGTYTATKYYAGPVHYINGTNMAPMVVFLSDYAYEGEGAPDDNDEVFDALQLALTDSKGETEADRERYIDIDTTNMTFTVESGHDYTTLDWTDGYWTYADLVAGGYISEA